MPSGVRPWSRLWWRQAAVYAALGTASTGAYLGLFAALRQVADAQLANVVAMALSTVANTAANRRFTFGVRGTQRVAGQQLRGLVLFVGGLALNAVALEGLRLLRPESGRIAELLVLLVASLVAAAARFHLMRVWVFAGALARSGPVLDVDPASADPATVDSAAAAVDPAAADVDPALASATARDPIAALPDSATGLRQ